MASNDLYLSDEEDLFESYDSGALSSAYLGFTDLQIDYDGNESSDELPTIEDTFIGGYPLWFNENSKPKDSMVSCGNCGKKMALLLQAFAPLDGKLYDRVIYIFACKDTRSCSRKKGSIKCIRAISKDPVKMEKLKDDASKGVEKEMEEKLKLEEDKQKQLKIGEDLFKDAGGSSQTNPFGGSNPFDQVNPFASNKAPGPKTSDSGAPNSTKQQSPVEEPEAADIESLGYIDRSYPGYPGYFVFVEPEKRNKAGVDPDLEKYKHLIAQESDNEGSSSADAGLESVANALNPKAAQISRMMDDKCFENFTNVLRHNSTQVLRYDLGGKPLLYSSKGPVAKAFLSATADSLVPRPAYNPSSLRRFELQLMPKAILDLSAEDLANADSNAIINGMSWGTIIICTDTEDYIPPEYFDLNHVAYIEDWVGVQWEEAS